MEPKLNPELKRIISNPEIGRLITNEILNNSNKISPINVVLEDQSITIIPIGYTGKENTEKKK